jgi:VanZ family protein
MDTTPLPSPPMINFDKLVHTVMFLGLSGVIFFDNTNYLRNPISKKRIFWSIFLFPVILGGLIEIIQEYFTATRSGDWFDFLFNILGSLLGMGIALLINRYYLMRKKHCHPALDAGSPD